LLPLPVNSARIVSSPAGSFRDWCEHCGPTRFNKVLSQGHPIATGCYAVILREPAIESRGSTLRPVVSVFTIGSKELGEVEVVLTPVGGTVSSIGEGIPLVSGSQDLLGGPQALGTRGLPGLHGCQPPFEAGLSFVGLRPHWKHARLPIGSCCGAERTLRRV
jgi:hypothetical protein